jgi:hypothetical protein
MCTWYWQTPQERNPTNSEGNLYQKIDLSHILNWFHYHLFSSNKKLLLVIFFLSLNLPQNSIWNGWLLGWLHSRQCRVPENHLSKKVSFDKKNHLMKEERREKENSSNQIRRRSIKDRLGRYSFCREIFHPQKSLSRIQIIWKYPNIYNTQCSILTTK